jgi:CheY-like chemotaxis protein
LTGTVAVGSADLDGTDRPQDATILVVEDDADVRALTITMLKSLGYAVLEADKADAALDVINGNGPVDLLLTDVVLPGQLNGRDLAEKISEILPGIAVLYMSGYTENSIIRHEQLDEGIALLQKPFRRADLAHKVEAALTEARSTA